MKTKILVFTIFLTIATFFGSAMLPNDKVKNVSWTLIQENDLVSIYRSYQTIENKMMVCLKIENQNSQTVKVTWQSQFLVSNNAIDVNMPFALIIEPNSILDGTSKESKLIFDPYQFVSFVEEGVSDYQVINYKIIKL